MLVIVNVDVIIMIFEKTFPQVIELLHLLQDSIQFREEAEALEASAHTEGRESDDDDLPFCAGVRHGWRRIRRGTPLPRILPADRLRRYHAGVCLPATMITHLTSQKPPIGYIFVPENTYPISDSDPTLYTVRYLPLSLTLILPITNVP